MLEKMCNAQNLGWAHMLIRHNAIIDPILQGHKNAIRHVDVLEKVQVAQHCLTEMIESNVADAQCCAWCPFELTCQRVARLMTLAYYIRLFALTLLGII